MSAYSFPNACCKRFGSIAIHCIDASCSLDSPLEAIASLCEEVTDLERIDTNTLSGVGAELRKYLENRRIVESAFFDRNLYPWQKDDPVAMCELRRIRAGIRGA